MKRSLIVLFFLYSLLNATIINVPVDQPTIQEGIDASTQGDTVLVQPGTYYENLNFNGKAITLGSLFYTTQDTSYISQTIIDGNQNDIVVTFNSGEDSTSVLTGFTIINGNAYYPYGGGGIYCNSSSPCLLNVTITDNSAEYYGGGIYCNSSNPSLTNVTITDNQAKYGGGIYCKLSNSSLTNVTITGNSAEYSGGGIYCSLYSTISLTNVTITDNSSKIGGGVCCYYSNPSFTNVMLADNSAENYGGGIYCESSNPSFTNVKIANNVALLGGGGIYLNNNSIPVFSSENRCNIYLNNTNNRGNGSDIYSFSSYNINVIVDTFTVINPTEFHAAPRENFTFDILHGLQDQVNADLYVSPEGDNDNNGLTIDAPLQTIQYACSVILADSLNPHTIHLAEGIYSPSINGEFFPINIPDYVTLSGISERGVILDAEGVAAVIMLSN